MDQREYQTVVLAALLHDIGKFMNRGENVRRKHPLFSSDYVSDEKFKNLVKEEWVDLGLLKTLVQRHHEYSMMPEDLLVQEITDAHTRALAYIVSRADTYSSGERIEEEPSELNFKESRLMSILTKVDIGKGKPTPLYYNLGRISPSSVFPVEFGDLAQLTHHYDRLLKDFGMAFLNFKPGSFDALFNGYLSLFEEFLWCVPSDTRDQYNDISLYDHLSTTSAITACLYQYHKDNFDERSIKDDGVEKFMLVGGDISGIQKFIFEIGSTNPKKLSKILRGRSFYLSLLSEVASLKILRGLQLPISCRIMNAGGRFVLLVPNTPAVKKTIIKLQNEIEGWFYNQFLGKLALNLAMDITLSRKGFSSEVFSKKQKDLAYNLECSKKKRFSNILMGNQALMYGAMREAYETMQQGDKVCDFCKIYPKVNEEEHCQTCLDSIEIGKSIVSKPFIHFYEGERSGGIHVMGYTLAFKSEGDDWVMLEKIGNDDRGENTGYIKRYISNYIPKRGDDDIDLNEEKPKEGDTLCRFCGSLCKLEGDRQQGVPPREELVFRHLTFQCIAASSRRANNGKGVDHLAVIKADVDDLGYIFSKGLGVDMSISRYASLSRMLNYFFTGWLTEKIEKNYPMAYAVYAGGDDLLLIAPWQDALSLGSDIAAKFREYAGKNPNITISMGINLMRPNSPVGLATEGAEDNLKKSKEAGQSVGDQGKDRLTVFDTTIKWSEFNELKRFMALLDRAFNELDSRVNASFLYRLLKYQDMYRSSHEDRFIEGLKFHSAMTRDIRRNIERRDNTGRVINQEIIDILRPLHEVGTGFNSRLMSKLKFPVFWTLYKNRGGGR
ncbi:MAG: type III-A CRISPR-associated protein Cas10/Csm1 [Nitrospirae bacterium]|nr:type III-A CRISPR-associated protein Cas10/Csm1 [Nitrospirota bacterium]